MFLLNKNMASNEKIHDSQAGEHGDESESKGKKAVKHDSGAADLEKVTDFVEEKEISQQDIQDAMKAVSDRQNEEAQNKNKKEKELSKVKINKSDVDLIVQEMEIPRIKAERVLREYKGNLVDALTVLTN